MNNDQLIKTEIPQVVTDTYTVTLDSAELCGDPTLTVKFTLSKPTSSAVTVTWLGIVGKPEYHANTLASKTSQGYTAKIKLQKGQKVVTTTDSMFLMVEVGQASTPWSNTVHVKNDACTD